MHWFLAAISRSNMSSGENRENTLIAIIYTWNKDLSKCACQNLSGSMLYNKVKDVSYQTPLTYRTKLIMEVR